MKLELRSISLGKDREHFGRLKTLTSRHTFNVTCWSMHTRTHTCVYIYVYITALEVASNFSCSLIECTQKNSVMALGKGYIKTVLEEGLQF